jgi:phenylpropionate dioxygenase-like ring-hydroxylating dioxygenase large terminal subunit
VTLLDHELAVAIGEDGNPLALTDRCAHRSTRLSVGTVHDNTIRCAYHGWRYGRDGQCTEIPSMPDAPIPPRACVTSYSAKVAYGLVWVCLDPRLDIDIPPCAPTSSATSPAMRVLTGTPYTWPVSAARRVENFVDLAHFAWVHDGSLGRRDEPVPPLPTITRDNGALHFAYHSPDMDADGRALFGSQQYLMAMPLTVQITFTQLTGGTRILWMTASPISMDVTRCFWFIARNDALDEADADHMAFQDQILNEDAPVVCNQSPAALSLEPTAELSVKTDRVSIDYRRFLRDLALATRDTAQLIALLRSNASTPTVPTPTVPTPTVPTPTVPTS